MPQQHLIFLTTPWPFLYVPFLKRSFHFSILNSFMPMLQLLLLRWHTVKTKALVDLFMVWENFWKWNERCSCVVRFMGNRMHLVPVPGSILVFGLSCCDVAEFYWVCCSGFTWTERTGLLLPLALGTVLTVSGEHPQPRHFFFVLKLKFKLNTFFIFIHCLITLCFFSQKKLHYVWTKW